MYTSVVYGTNSWACFLNIIFSLAQILLFKIISSIFYAQFQWKIFFSPVSSCIRKKNLSPLEFISANLNLWSAFFRCLLASHTLKRKGKKIDNFFFCRKPLHKKRFEVSKTKKKNNERRKKLSFCTLGSYFCYLS